MAKKSEKLVEIREMMSVLKPSEIENIGIEPLKELEAVYEGIPDSRFQPYVEHLLSDIVMIVLLAVLAYADEWEEIGEFAREKEGWLRKFLRLPNGIPSHDTIQRVMSQIDGNYLYSLTIQFLIMKIEHLDETAWLVRLRAQGTAEEREAEPKILACDGKTSCGSKRSKTDRDAIAAVQTVSVYSTDYGLCVSEAVVNEKTNEIPTIQEMLGMLHLEGSIVTWDALNTQKETVKIVVERKGDYVGALKGNQQTFYEDVELYFDESTCKELEKSAKTYTKTIDKEQSGVATREYYLTDDIKWLSQKEKWAGLKAIGCARRTLEQFSGKTTVETRYFIASITNIDYFAKAVRRHWSIENKIHWHLDYTFKDDQNTTTEKHGAQNLQTMKRAALAILTLVQTYYAGISLKKIRYKLSLNYEHHIEQIFKLLNADALRSLLLPKSG